MPKVAKNARTPLQERLLTSIALLTCTVGEGRFIASSAINRIMGGRFTKYRQTQLDQLVTSKWLECKISTWHGIKFYRMTETGWTQLSREYDIKTFELLPESEFQS